MSFIKPLDLLFFISFLLICTHTLAQNDSYRYLILFKDKANSPYSIAQPDKFLSTRSIERRKKFKIALQEQDLPVNPDYLINVQKSGAKVLFSLKWINGALIQQKPKDLAKTLSQAGVKGLYYAYPIDSSSSFQISKKRPKLPDLPQASITLADSLDYGNSSTQISQLGVNNMHLKGFHGEGILISVLDEGFQNANNTPFLLRAFSEKRIIATLTTTPGLSDVYSQGSHGTHVLSTIAAFTPGKLIGTAYQAQFALAQTEEGSTEKIVEEVNWLRGAEWADSLGTDIISSSLGYTIFDLKLSNHTYAEMNGKTALSSKAAAWAAQRGIICTISAGNEGAANWKYISSPADADSILAVAAVDKSMLRANFSSWGPSSDGRIKPDVAAMGLATAIGSYLGTYTTSNGTSFSAPLMAGLVAGTLQANPNKSPWQVMNAIRQSGHQSSNPDNSLGYGVPNFNRIDKLLNPILSIEEIEKPKILIYPNVLRLGEVIHLEREQNTEIKVELISNWGAIIHEFLWTNTQQDFYPPPLVSGKYYFRFTDKITQQVIPFYFSN
ncbi:S8 family serine peptidase [Aquirufa nivalisilvae]|uniref:S8 family serine peptidase n=1 Tax=Aquirufa nivalisilvae TaxID=2516557 RepID=UPI0022A9C23F|nr:S8 family serine peptidase [Aquirufa nivalisilvae]MCZ2481167.1 S8 family serine peptidase [Aquirufa nivalisilvae]MCZ2482004.1 S8 family serine peptidase [Aquirufa nivalisilvae]